MRRWSNDNSDGTFLGSVDAKRDRRHCRNAQKEDYLGLITCNRTTDLSERRFEGSLEVRWWYQDGEKLRRRKRQQSTTKVKTIRVKLAKMNKPTVYRRPKTRRPRLDFGLAIRPETHSDLVHMITHISHIDSWPKTISKSNHELPWKHRKHKEELILGVQVPPARPARIGIRNQ